MGNFIANGDDQCVDDVKKTKAQRQHTYLLPAHHPAVEPVGKAPAMGEGMFRISWNILEMFGHIVAVG